jgi:hypothetical protein
MLVTLCRPRNLLSCWELVSKCYYFVQPGVGAITLNVHYVSYRSVVKPDTCSTAGSSSQGQTDVSLRARLRPDDVSHAVMELVRTDAENENVVGNLEFERSPCGPLLKRLGTSGNVEEACGGSGPVKADTNG